jgi:hypothetical protein
LFREAIHSISGEARAWAQFYLDRVDTATQKENEALSSLMVALMQTIKYIGEVTKDPKVKSNETEQSLNQQWFKAAIKVRPYNAALADKCFLKGIHWTDNEHFTHEEIVVLGITIQDMKHHVSSAIKNV